MARRIVTAFAESGDRTPISNSPIGTVVSYENGYPSEYEQDPEVNPLTARFVERVNENQFKHDMSSNIKEWQEQVYPEFITSANNEGSPFPYDKNAVVSFGGEYYISLFDANEDIPTTSKWKPLEGKIPASGGGSLVVNQSYLITDASTYTLPDTTNLSTKDFVEVERLGAALFSDPTPLIQVDGSNSENIEYYDNNGVIDETDVSVQYNIFAPMTFLFNATSGNWEL